ncbi:uncharacterized protein [Littorina saxatilis]|uniref:uncharacterized protein n=1 Tax=Littorina saxatilis TaxID=31220 RepID=UPI0038B46545
MEVNTTTATTLAEAHAQPEADMTALAPAIAYTSLMMLMGAIGNAVVCYVYGFRWQSTVTKIFIFSLAVLDLSNSLICMPTEIVMLVKIVSFDSPAWCKLSRFLTYTLNGSSSLILVSIALDRWYKVCRPMKHFFDVRRAKLTCVGAVGLAASLSWPALVLYGSLTVSVVDSDVMGVTCLVSDDFIGTWWPLLFYSLYFACYAVLVVSITVLYSLIAVRIVQLKRKQKQRLTATCTGLRASRICSPTQELVLVEVSHHDNNDNHHHHHGDQNDNNNDDNGGGKKGALKIHMINEEAELLEEELIQSALATVEIVPQFERIQEENDRRRSVKFKLPQVSCTDGDTITADCVLESRESESNQSATGGVSDIPQNGQENIKVIPQAGVNQNGLCVPESGSDGENCTSKASDTLQRHGHRAQVVEAVSADQVLQTHTIDAAVDKTASGKEFQNGEDVDDVTDNDCEMKKKNFNLSIPYRCHEDNRLLSRLSSHSHTDSPDEDTDSFEQGIHFVSPSEICWQHNPIADPDVINNDVSVISDVNDESMDELGTSGVWLLHDQVSPDGKAKLEKTKSGTSVVPAPQAKNCSKKKKVQKTVSESQAFLQTPTKQQDGGVSSRSSFLFPPGGYPGGHTPTSRLPTPTGGSPTDNRPVRLSNALLLERLSKKMAYRPAKTTRMLFAISIVFVVSFLPFFCVVIARAVHGKAFLTSLTDVGVVLISIFIRSSFLSNAANPIIYGLCNKQFRTECRRLVRRFSGKEHDVTMRVMEQTDDAIGSENS